MQKILIAAPARQDPRIFDEYRKSIDNLVIPDGYVVDNFFVINNCQELIPHLHETDLWATYDTDEGYTKTENDHLWTSSNMQRVGFMRNITIAYALQNGYDYWFSIDTDLVLHPNTLKQLLSADKDIVSEIFFTNGWCNAWMFDQYTTHPKEWESPGLYRCGMTGACMLVKRKVLESGVDYTFIPNIVTALRGEDRHFCVKAAVHHFELWVDTHYPCRHLYTEEEYVKYMKETYSDQEYEKFILERGAEHE